MSCLRLKWAEYGAYLTFLRPFFVFRHPWFDQVYLTDVDGAQRTKRVAYSISTILTVLSWICAGIYVRGAAFSFLRLKLADIVLI